MASWKLIERNEDEILSLLHAADIPRDAVQIRKEETGLIYIVDICK
jgi:hypothetical protein